MNKALTRLLDALRVMRVTPNDDDLQAFDDLPELRMRLNAVTDKIQTYSSRVIGSDGGGRGGRGGLRPDLDPPTTPH